ncbi:MAG: hypothetical protein IKN72_02815 [Clostridia bacterium]|nr:hypothetical protein [Clostridia bacterium]
MKLRSRLLSLLLALVLALTLCVPALGARYPYDRDDHYTQIYVEGLVSKWVTHPDEPGVSLFTPVDTGRLMTAFSHATDYMKDALAKGDPDLLYHAMYDPLVEFFGEAALLPDGYTMKDTVTVPPTKLYQMEGNKFLFQFDARLDPVDIAKELDDYIRWVKAEGRVTMSRYHNTVTDKIELVGSSYGAAVVEAYLHEYGCENIDSVLLCVPTVGGVRMVGDLFTGDFSFDAKALRDTLKGLEQTSEFDPLIEVLEKSGALQILLSDVLTPALKAAFTQALHDALHDTIATMPSFWSFVDDEHFEAAIDYMFGKEGEKETYQGLIDRITYYHYEVFNHASDILLDAQASGVHCAVICKYNSATIPVSADDNALSDGIMPVETASFGATAAKSRGTLPADYTQQKFIDVNYLSPDRMIDASTCLLPEHTWFIKDLWHGTKCDDYFDMINKIIYENLDVFTDPTLPQFLQYDEAAKTLSPLTAGDAPAQQTDSSSRLSWFGTLARFLMFLVKMAQKLFARVKG